MDALLPRCRLKSVLRGVWPNSACRRRDGEEFEWPTRSLEVDLVRFECGFWSSAAWANENVRPLEVDWVSKRLRRRRGTRRMEIRNDREGVNECMDDHRRVS